MELSVRRKKKKKPHGSSDSVEDFEGDRGSQQFKRESSDPSCSSPSPDTVPRLDADDTEASFSKLREVYAMGESWFGSAFVLQVPGVYLCLHKSQMPSFMESHIYKEMQTTGEALLRDMLNREQNDSNNKNAKSNSDGPFAKRRKTSTSGSAPPTYDLTSDMDFSIMDFESLIKDTPIKSFKDTVKGVFSDYRHVSPLHKRVVPLNIQGCAVWDTTKLKRGKILLPNVTEHIHRPLLVKYYRSKPTINKMPHCKFTRPMHPKIKPGYSLHNIIL